MFYSKKTNGFYAPEMMGDYLLAGTLPDDVREITAEEERDLRAPGLITLQTAKTNKILAISFLAQKCAAAFTADYPDFEKDTWPDQQAEVLAWDLNSNSLTPCLDAIALYRGIDRDELLLKTLGKVQTYRSVGWYLAGTRQKYEDLVKAALTQAEVEAIDPVFELPI